MVKTEQKALVFGGNLQQRHLMVLPTAERGASLGVDAQHFARKEIIHRAVGFRLVVHHRNLTREIH